MHEAVAQPEAVGRTGGFRIPRRRVAALVLVGATLVVGLAIGAPGNGAHTSSRLADSPAIEGRWGVRMSSVSVVADGGIVDVRFIVIDPDKALAMMDDPANLPALRPAGTQVVIQDVAQMAPRHDLVAGQTYFLLYHNSGGALHPGTRLSLTFGDLVIPDVVAQ